MHRQGHLITSLCQNILALARIKHNTRFMTVFRVSYQLALVFLVNELKTEVWVCIHDCPSMMVHSIPDGGVLIFKFNIHRMNGSILNTIDQVIAGDKGLLALEYLLTIS